MAAPLYGQMGESYLVILPFVQVLRRLWTDGRTQFDFAIHICQKLAEGTGRIPEQLCGENEAKLKSFFKQLHGIRAEYIHGAPNGPNSGI